MITLKNKVKNVLETDQESRNSDIRLTQMVWFKYHKEKFIMDKNGNAGILVRDLFDLPREDHISRVRRAIQEEAVKKYKNGQLTYSVYLPTDIKVARARKMNEINWRQYLGL